MPIIDNLFIKLGYKYDAKNLERFNKLSEGTGRILKGVSLGALGLATSFSILFTKISANALVQQRFGKAMGISRDSIAAFARTSEEITGERGTASRFIEQFNGIQNSLKAGIAPSENFLRSISMVGIELDEFQKLSPDEALLKVAEGFQAVDEDSKDAISSLLGLDSAGRNLFEGLTQSKLKENMPSPADIASIEKFDKLLLRLKTTFNDAIITFGTPLFEELIPTIELLTKKMPLIIRYTKTATESFVKFGKGIGIAIGFAVIETEKLINLLKKIAGPITKSEYQDPENKFSGVTGFIEGFARQELGLFGGTTTSNNSSTSNVKQNFNIQITSDNPEIVAETIQKISQEQMSQANRNLSSRVVN